MTVQYIAPTKRKKIDQKEAARLFLVHNGICCNCGQQIRPGEKWFIEHPEALVLGGTDAGSDENRKPSHVSKCKAKKDAADASARSKRDRIITKDWQRGEGTSRPKPKIPNRPWGGMPSNTKQIHEDVE